MTNTFEEDLELGHRAEEYILKVLKLVYPTMRRIEGKNVHYDLIDDTGLTVEVKLDLKSKETGHIGIEYMHRGVLSGISISKAKRWILVYYCNGWVWTMVETPILRKYIKKNHAKYTRYIGQGDKSSLLIIKVEEIQENFGSYPVKK